MIVYIMMQYPVPSETFAASDIAALRNSGMEVKVLSLKSKHFFDRLKALAVCILHPLKFSSLLFSGLLDFKSFLLTAHALRCWSEIHDLAPKQVHLFWGHYPSLVGFLIKKYNPKIKVSLFLGAYDLELDLKISRWMIQHTDLLVTHSKANRAQLIEMGARQDQVHVIHRGIDVDGLKNSILDLPKKNDSWISVGRLIKSKGFDLVIKSFANYQALHSQAKLTIVGDGPDAQALHALADQLGVTSKVHFTGALTHKDVLKQMSSHEYFVFLSSKPGERLPNVIKEAMLAGCICISSYTPGIDELIDDGQDGFIVRHDQALSASDFEALLSNKDLGLIAHKARLKIEKSFNADVQMAAYRKLWDVSQNANSSL